MGRNVLAVVGLACSLAAVALAGCKSERFTTSPVLYEGARVVDMGYTPPTHGEGTGVAVGYGAKGGVSVGPAFVSIETAPHWVVMFECGHGRFVIDRDTPGLFRKLHGGDSVRVAYREVYRERVEGKRVIERALHDYDFVDAEVVR